MKRTKFASLMAGALMLLAGCGGGGGGDPVVTAPPVTEAIPAEAGTSTAAATRYLAALTAVAAALAEVLEPVNLGPATLAGDDAAEPAVVQ